MSLWRDEECSAGAWSAERSEYQSGGIDGGVAWLAGVVILRALFLGLWVWYEGVVNRKEYIYYAGVRTEYC